MHHGADEPVVVVAVVVAAVVVAAVMRRLALFCAPYFYIAIGWCYIGDSRGSVCS